MRNNFLISKEELEKLRTKFTPGKRVKLLKMDDISAPPKGTLGTVRDVDDVGTIFVKWDNGSGLGAAYGEDIIQLVDTEPAKGVV